MRLKLKLPANSAEPAMSYEEVPKVLSLCHIVLCAMSLLQQTRVRPAAMARLPTDRKSGPLHLTVPFVGEGFLAEEWYFVIWGTEERWCEGGLRTRMVSKGDDREGSESVQMRWTKEKIISGNTEEWTTEPQNTTSSFSWPLTHLMNAALDWVQFFREAAHGVWRSWQVLKHVLCLVRILHK